jgi:hypothetical protein
MTIAGGVTAPYCFLTSFKSIFSKLTSIFCLNSGISSKTRSTMVLVLQHLAQEVSPSSFNKTCMIGFVIISHYLSLVKYYLKIENAFNNKWFLL